MIAMAPIRIPPALRWALCYGKEAAASMDTNTMCKDTFLSIGFLPFSIATVHKAYHTEKGDSHIRPLPPKPPEIIPWHPFLCNRIDLIGNLVQHVDITYLDSGRTRGTSVLRCLQRDRKSLLFHVEFWDELAEMAAAHTRKGTVVHVSGILHIANMDEGRKSKFQWTVAATKLNLVARNSSSKVDSSQTSTQENIQEVDDKPSVKVDESMNCETAQTIVQASNEHIEKCPMKDDNLRRSTPKIIEAVDADVEITSIQDDCTCDLRKLTQETIEAVDADVEETPVQDECTREIQDENFF